MTQDIMSLKEYIHYPECWDTAVYPTLQDAIDAVGPFKCCNDDCSTATNYAERIRHAVRILSAVNTYEGRKASRILETLIEDMER